MDYSEADEAFLEVVESDARAMMEGTLGTAFPQTYWAMFGFCAKTNALKSAMFELQLTENPYAFRVMFRCLCEHYLKFMYVFTRFMREKSDEVGVEYRSFCGALEMHEYADALELAEGLVGNSIVTEVERLLSAVYPQAAQLTKSELERASAKFRYWA